jgi:IS30 family transposase
MKPLSTEIRQKARELYEAGQSSRQVAKVLQVSHSWVDKVCRDIRRSKSDAGVLSHPSISTHWRTCRTVSRRKLERHLGHKLPPNVVVHHEDEDFTNKDLSNLKPMTRAAHARLHNTKTHCIRGHLLVEPNVRWSFRTGRGQWKRACKLCDIVHSERRKQRAS